MATRKEGDVEICPDNHRCENGSVCVENSLREGQFFCDCEESMLSGATVFSGLYCQHEATVYCTITGEVSRTSFCTNMGTCRGNLDEENEHVGCDCPRGYTGTHCQFIEGSEGPYLETPPALAENYVKKDRGGDGTGLSTAGLVFIILLSLGVLGLTLAVVFRRARQYATTHTIESSKSSDGNMPEPDGSSTLAAMPTRTQTFETLENSDASEERHDDLQITDSGHLA